MGEFDYVTDRGREAIAGMLGPGEDDRLDQYARRAADQVDGDWARILVGYVSEGMYARTILSTAQRELCAVAALTVLQRTGELESHIDIALNSSPVDEVREVILQMSVYGGVPVTFSTLGILEQVLAKRAAREGSEPTAP